MKRAGLRGLNLETNYFSILTRSELERKIRKK